jgi:NAD(P)-dependent dehydrogenase (short-subunit alcohol dehydrogenase family)
MEATAEPTPMRVKSPDDSFTQSLTCLEAILDRQREKPIDSSCCDVLTDELRRLHVRFRAHDAAGYFASVEAVPAAAPELAEDITRLCGEHQHILGQLDWVVRNAGALVDRPVEDQEVFVLRLRELIAVLRRHEAEEDRVFFLAVWRDTGGEGG